MASGWASSLLVMAMVVTGLVEGYTKGKPPVRKLEVQLKQGPILTVREDAGNGKFFFSFKSIPYARPPVGDLRFKDPVPAGDWREPRDGTVDPPLCPQLFRSQPTGEEDCLYLNVHTPDVNDTKLPVMVWFHGGAYLYGGIKYYPALPMLTKNVVLVVVQFRLATLGFLSSEDNVMPGNLGLKDQTLALRWVQDNIHDLGGDPHTVTIFGESAGAASVHFHMMNPQAEGLFQRAILQSGSALCPWTLREDHRRVAIKVGELFNCSASDSASQTLDSTRLLACLQKVPAYEFLDMYSAFHVWNNWPWVMVPRVDGHFLPDHPATLLKSGRYHKHVDIISGVTRDDGGIFSIGIILNQTKINQLEANFSVVGPVSLYMGDWEEESLEYMARRTYYHYLGQTKITLDKVQEVTQLLTDRFFKVDHEETSAIHSAWGASTGHKVYKFELEHRAEFGLADRHNSSLTKNWVVHGDDLLHLFNIPSPAPGPLAQPADLFMRDIILTLWTNFAATGNPTPDGSLGFRWCPTSETNQWYLALNTSPVMKRDSSENMLEFWRNMPTKKNLLLHPERFVQNKSCPADGPCGEWVGRDTVHSPQYQTQEQKPILFRP